jgi:hypothetical protein
MTITAHDTTTAPVATAPVRTLGIVALVLGILSVASGFNPIMGVAGLVVGILSLRQEPDGRGFAITGIVTGALSTLGTLLGIGAFLVALPFLALFGAWGW